MNQLDVLTEGAEIVAAALRPNGFEFTRPWVHEYPSLVDRGERVVRAAFVKMDRRLELELWASLQNVTYRIDALWLRHEPYMRALGVTAGMNHYPGFSNNPIDGFRHLRSDLERFGSDFVIGDAAMFRRAAAEAAEHRPVEQRRYMALNAGDDRARSNARELFRAKRYADVVALLEGLQYPEFMEPFEQQIFEVAKRKVAETSG